MRSRNRLYGVLLIGALLFSACGSGLPEETEFVGIDAEMFRGPEHCGWEGTHFVLINERLQPDRENYAEPVPQIFVRNTDQVPEYIFEETGDLSRPMPDDAERIGESEDGSIELWFSDSDPIYLYVVGEGFTEAWLYAAEWMLCE